MSKRSSASSPNLTVLELVSLKEALEEKWGVSAAAAAVAVAAPAAGGGGGAEEAVEEKTAFDVMDHRGRQLEDPGHQGDPRRDRPGPEGGQGRRRRRSEGRQGGLSKDDAERSRRSSRRPARPSRSATSPRRRMLVVVWRAPAVGPSAVLGWVRSRTVTAWAKRQRGPLAITLAFLVLGMMNLILVPPFVPRDESSHVTYALAIADGRFPRIDDTNPAGAIPGLEPFKTWTANHPPLFYVLSAVPLEAGKAIDEPVLGLRGMRLLNLLFGAVAVLPGGRARRAAAAAPARGADARGGRLGLAGAVANNLAVAYNDGLGLAAAIALLVVACGSCGRARRAGCSWRWRCSPPSAAWRGSPSSWRSASLRCWRPPASTCAGPARRVLAAAAAFCLPFAAAAVASGWWYLRNRREYGSFTGTSFIIQMQGRGPHAGYLELLQTPWFWRKMHSDIWGAFVRSGSLAGWPRRDPRDRVGDRHRLPAGRARAVVAVGPAAPRPLDAIAWTLAGAFAVAERLADREVLHHGWERPRAVPVRRPAGGRGAGAVAFQVLPFNRREYGHDLRDRRVDGGRLLPAAAVLQQVQPGRRHGAGRDRRSDAARGHVRASLPGSCAGSPPGTADAVGRRARRRRSHAGAGAGERAGNAALHRQRRGRAHRLRRGRGRRAAAGGHRPDAGRRRSPVCRPVGCSTPRTTRRSTTRWWGPACGSWWTRGGRSAGCAWPGR